MNSSGVRGERERVTCCRCVLLSLSARNQILARFDQSEFDQFHFDEVEPASTRRKSVMSTLPVADAIC